MESACAEFQQTRCFLEHYTATVGCFSSCCTCTLLLMAGSMIYHTGNQINTEHIVSMTVNDGSWTGKNLFAITLGNITVMVSTHTE